MKGLIFQAFNDDDWELYRSDENGTPSAAKFERDGFLYHVVIDDSSVYAFRYRGQPPYLYEEAWNGPMPLLSWFTWSEPTKELFKAMLNEEFIAQLPYEPA